MSVPSSIYGVHDEAKDKDFELEMSWVCDESNRQHEKVSLGVKVTFMRMSFSFGYYIIMIILYMVWNVHNISSTFFFSVSSIWFLCSSRQFEIIRKKLLFFWFMFLDFWLFSQWHNLIIIFGIILIKIAKRWLAFVSKRVTEQTLDKAVPEGSQAAEYLFHKGLCEYKNSEENCFFFIS